MTRRTLLIGIVCFTLLLASPSALATGIHETPSTQLSDDDWADSCTNATQIESGEYHGALSPDDHDHFIINLSNGEHIVFNISASGPAESIVISSDDGQSPVNFTAENGSSLVDTDSDLDNIDRLLIPTAETSHQFRMYSEGSGLVCLNLHPAQTAGAANWTFTFATNQSKAPPINVSNALDRPSAVRNSD